MLKSSISQITTPSDTKHVLIIASPYKPIPAFQGGAIETMLDQYLQHFSHHIDQALNQSQSNRFNLNFTIYSYTTKPKQLLKNIKSNLYPQVHFRFISRQQTMRHPLNYLHKLRHIISHDNLHPPVFAHAVIRDLKHRHELQKYDLVIIVNQVDAITTYRKYFPHSKLVEYLHNDYLNTKTTNAKIIAQQCDAIWVISDFLHQQIAKITHDIPVRVIYNGINLHPFTHSFTSSELQTLRKKLHLSSKQRIFLYSGRIFPEKGVLELVQAFRHFAKSHPDATLLIIGSIKEPKDQAYLQQIKNLSTNQVRLLGEIPYSELPIYYALADIQVIPSLWEEAFGLVFIEGLAANNAIITTDSGGLAEIATNHAIVIKRQNLHHNLITALEQLSQSSTLRHQLTANSAQFLKTFTIDAYCQRLNLAIINALYPKGVNHAS